MVFYIVIASVLWGFSLTSMVTRRHFAFLSLPFFIGLIIIAALRPGVGTDYNEYVNIWNTFNNFNSDQYFGYYYSGIEIGYKYLVFFASFIGGKDFYFFCNALLSVGLLFCGVYRIRYQYNICFPLFLFVFFCCFYIPYSLNAMRQGISMAIFVFCLRDFIDKNIINVSIASLIACTMHSTGCLIIISYFLFNSRIKLGYWFFVLFFIFLIGYITKIIPVVINIISPGKYDLFADKWGGAGVQSILLRVLILSVLFLSMKVNNLGYNYDRLILVYSLGAFLYFVFYDAGMLASRFNMFFRILEVVLYSHILLSFNGFKKLFFYVFILFVSLFQLYVAASNPDNFWTVW